MVGQAPRPFCKQGVDLFLEDLSLCSIGRGSDQKRIEMGGGALKLQLISVTEDGDDPGTGILGQPSLVELL